MKNTLAHIALLAALLLVGTWASYQYYGSTPLQSYNNDAPNWDINHSGNASENVGTGLTVTSANGASYIARSGPPDGSSQYEAAMTLALANSGGSYVLYLEASSKPCWARPRPVPSTPSPCRIPLWPTAAAAPASRSTG